MPNAAQCAVVIFGASGDLSQLKLVPALYQLLKEGLLSENFALVGYARSSTKKDGSPLNDEVYRNDCCEAIRKHARTKPIDEALLKKMRDRIYYVAGGYDSVEDHAHLAQVLAKADAAHNTGGNRLFYISTPPDAFEGIITRLGERLKPGTPDRPSGFQRLIIEKPFGRDLASAKHLNSLLHSAWEEDQIFRIDHYLGKEALQNMMVMRFANSIFEPIWNYKYIDHVQITVSETLSADDRAGYYEKSGAMRDMIQNHIFQLMALVAMEPPVALDATSIRDEKVKVYRSIRPMRPDQFDTFCVRGQYGPGEYLNKDKKVPTNGYLKAKGVAPTSVTETFAAVKLYIDNWRWSGTPFFIRTGKCLNKKLSEVAVRFRSPPLTLFQKQSAAHVYPNDLIIRVQPEEGMSWRLNGKVPGGTLNIKSVALDFQYSTAFNVQPPEAYERLIHDGMIGDQSLFIRGDEAEAAWQVIDPIEKHWATSKIPPQQYEPGSWGPSKSIDLIEDGGRRWIQTADGEAEPIIACSM